MKLEGAIAKDRKASLKSLHFSAGHHKPPRIWIIVADRKKALIFSKAGPSIEKIGEAYPSKLEEHEKRKKKGKKKEEEKETTAAQSEEKGLQIDFEPAMSPARRRAFKFAHEIAHWLDTALRQEAFDRLIFVAPPQTLGDLRGALSKPVFSRLLAEVNKNLSKLDAKDIKNGLERISWF